MLNVIISWGPIGSFLLIAVGTIVLIGGGDCLLRGAARLAVALGIPPLIVGLTVVAFCTSAPEFSVSLLAAWRGNVEIAVGSVVGSNICNICLILGISAVMTPIAVSSTLIRREIPWMILVSILMYGFAVTGGDGPLYSIFDGKYEGRIVPREGAILLGCLVFYIAWTVYEVLRHPSRNGKFVLEIEERAVPENDRANAGLFGPGNIVVHVCRLIIGAAMLVAGSEMLVRGGVEVARTFGVSELMVGLTLLAIGTSLPELVVSLLAVSRGHNDLAIGNVVGSCTFNILGVLGPSAMAASGGLAVSPKAIQFDIPLMILVSLLCIILCVSGKRISRGEGVLLLVCYAGYLVFLCIAEIGSF